MHYYLGTWALTIIFTTKLSGDNKKHYKDKRTLRKKKEKGRSNCSKIYNFRLPYNIVTCAVSILTLIVGSKVMNLPYLGVIILVKANLTPSKGGGDVANLPHNVLKGLIHDLNPILNNLIKYSLHNFK